MKSRAYNIVILNGPNLNLLGLREREIYGDLSFEDYFNQLKTNNPSLNLAYEQTNSEGILVDLIQEYGLNGWDIIINPGAYSHTSIAIRDALASIATAAVEIHISDIHQRESFRHHSYLHDVAHHIIIGKGIAGYQKAIDWFQERS